MLHHDEKFARGPRPYQAVRGNSVSLENLFECRGVFAVRFFHPLKTETGFLPYSLIRLEQLVYLISQGRVLRRLLFRIGLDGVQPEARVAVSHSIGGNI